MTTTTNYNIPKPDPTDNVDDEFYRLQTAWDMIDLILFLIATEVAGKSNLGHVHPMNQVTGLVAALASKMEASKTFNLDDLTDVDGAAAAALNYVLVKTSGGTWQPSSAIAALGPHQHAASDVVGLTAAITNGIAVWVGAAPSALDTLAEFATAIANDPNFANTITALIATKLALSGGTMTGPIDMGGNPISKVSSLNGGPLAGLRNKLLNGDFTFTERGVTSRTIAAGSNTILCDRWRVTNTSNQPVVVSQPSHTLGQTAVPGNPRFKMRLAFAVAPTSGGVRVEQRIEGVETFAGVTISSRGHFTGPAGTELLQNEIVQNFGTGGSPSAAVTTTPSVALDIATIYDATTQIRRAQFAVPSISGKTIGSGANDYLALAWILTPRQAGSYELSRMSLVEGDTRQEVDPFSPRPNAAELVLCQRYGQMFPVPPEFLNALSSALLYHGYSLPVKMRATPSASLFDTPNGYNSSGGALGMTTWQVAAIRDSYVSIGGGYSAGNCAGWAMGGAFFLDAEL